MCWAHRLPIYTHGDVRGTAVVGAMHIARQRPVEWCISVSPSTSVFMLGGLEFERDVLLEVEDGRVVHGEVAAV